jgi:hypothetical protein
MEAKEKAKTLINNFYNLRGMDWDMSISCSLIAVDEILKSVPKQPSISITMPHFEATVYWEEVKQEINKL